METRPIDIDEILEKIREEVKRREKKADPGKASPPLMHGFPLSSVKAPVPSGDRFDGLPNVEFEKSYHVSDFLRFQDRDFILHAYRGILGREPDPKGSAAFLKELREGKKSRVEILGDLRYSSEGRIKGMTIRGLLLPYLLRIPLRLPVVGGLFRSVSGILSLPSLLRRIQALEAQIQARRDLQEEDLDRVLRQVEDHFIEWTEETGFHAQAEEVRAVLAEVQEILSRKADREDVERIRAETFELNEGISGLREEVLGWLDGKADKEDGGGAFGDSLYASLEDRFRGDRQEIKRRQEVYLPDILAMGAGCRDAPVLDVGCGRGEWLELLKERNIAARGVDHNSLLVKRCQDLGLDVVESDILVYLQRVEDQSLGAITGFHIVEHLTLKTLLALIGESFRVLRPGGGVILETPNPENLSVGACDFYLDPTHRRPIPPETLAFLVSQGGFSDPRIVRSFPVDPIPHERDDPIPEISRGFHAGRDYAVIARKP